VPAETGKEKEGVDILGNGTTMKQSQKALLTLFGGRSFLPTALLVTHEKPVIVVAVSSEQSYKDLPQLQKAIDKFREELNFKCILETPEGIDAFDVEKIRSVCENAVIEHSDADWIFDITGGTSLMSLGAYQAAVRCREELDIPVKCWYLNTAQTRVIPLVGEKRDEGIFHISVDRYATAYNRTLKPGELEGIQGSDRQQWLQFAQMLGRNHHYATLLRSVMSKITGNRPKKDIPKTYQIRGLTDEVYTLLEEAQQLELLSFLNKGTDSTICFELSQLQDKFLNGAWLEAYVWDSARSLLDETGLRPLFDDCRWNQNIDGDSNNELDVLITYKAQLIVVECKTGDDAFVSNTLYKWDSVASMFGGKFVGKLLVTSLQKPSGADPNQHQAFEEFMARAHSKGIVVVTGTQLHDIGSILKEQAKNPEYPRI
jgi:hypothetical protein